LSIAKGGAQRQQPVFTGIVVNKFNFNFNCFVAQGVNYFGGNDYHFLSSCSNPKLKSVMKNSGFKGGANVVYWGM
jgi:hypothetical protein